MGESEGILKFKRDVLTKFTKETLLINKEKKE